MARFLSQTLTLTRLAPLSLSSSAEPSAAAGARLLSHRRRSNLPEKMEVPEEMEMERIAMKNLEDAIHRIIVKRSEPDWLPFVPGGSYWVPAKSKAHGVAQVIGKLLNGSTSSKTSMSKEQAFSLTYDRGWPSETYFFRGASHSPLEGETPTKHTSQSEEEEG